MYRVLSLILLLLSACVPEPSQQSKGNYSETYPGTLSSTYVKSDKRFALVIGNGDYDKNYNRLELDQLSNPVNDARGMAAVLQRLNYTVTLKTDVDKRVMDKAVRDFRERLAEEGGIGLFYFSGHGFQ